MEKLPAFRCEGQCGRKRRQSYMIQWYDRTNKDHIYRYCTFCFNAYKAGLMQMDRNPGDHIFVIKGADPLNYVRKRETVGSDTL